MVADVAVLYWLPHCSTCQKADAWLKAQGVKILRYHDLKAMPIGEAELDELIERISGAELLFSKRAMKYRSLGLDQQTLTPDDLRHHMLNEYTFIKRPVLVTADNGPVLAGFTEKQYKLWLQSQA